MADEKQDQDGNVEAPAALSRRDFVTWSVAAGLAVAAGASAAEVPVVESDVQVQTPDGVCDAAYIHPTSGTHPAVIVWPDAFGLRPSMRDIGKRIAAEGYAVLVPNPFYRVAKPSQVPNAASFDFQNQADMAKLRPLMTSVGALGAAEKDAAEAKALWTRVQKLVADYGAPIFLFFSSLLAAHCKARRASANRYFLLREFWSGCPSPPQRHPVIPRGPISRALRLAPEPVPVSSVSLRLVRKNGRDRRLFWQPSQLFPC